MASRWSQNWLGEINKKGEKIKREKKGSMDRMEWKDGKGEEREAMKKKGDVWRGGKKGGVCTTRGSFVYYQRLDQ